MSIYRVRAPFGVDVPANTPPTGGDAPRPDGCVEPVLRTWRRASVVEPSATVAEAGWAGDGGKLTQSLMSKASSANGAMRHEGLDNNVMLQVEHCDCYQLSIVMMIIIVILSASRASLPSLMHRLLPYRIYSYSFHFHPANQNPYTSLPTLFLEPGSSRDL